MHTFLGLSCLIKCLAELIVKTLSELLIGHNTLLYAPVPSSYVTIQCRRVNADFSTALKCLASDGIQ